MSNDIVHRCCVCEADFRPGILDKNGKCPICRATFPTVKNKAEAMALNRPEIHLSETLNTDKVKQIIREELNEFKAEQMVREDLIKFDIEKIVKEQLNGFKVEFKTEQKVNNMTKVRAVKQDKKNDSKEGKR